MLLLPPCSCIAASTGSGVVISARRVSIVAILLFIVVLLVKLCGHAAGLFGRQSNQAVYAAVSG
jgi:hypothetical protein